jgi:hypothetical protein
VWTIASTSGWLAARDCFGDKAVARRGRPNAREGSAYSDGPTHNIEEIKR